MLSITKINSVENKSAGGAAGGYLFYLGSPSTKERGDFDQYARASASDGAPRPFWAGRGAAELGLEGAAAAEAVQRLAEGFHPATGAPMAQGAGARHVMGADLTFSAPKDVSALFAGADAKGKADISACMRNAVEAALAYSESISVTRHGKGGRVKRRADAVVAACYPHFASRALDPQLHIHAFMFNVGKRLGSNDWSALDQKAQFDHKMSTGALFRAELASRLASLGFEVIPDGPYFTIGGIEDYQRDALSQRSQQIKDYLAEHGLSDSDGAAAREIASLNTRAVKAEPRYGELVQRFRAAADDLGLTEERVASLRQRALPPEAEPFAIDREALIEELTEQNSVATAQDALRLICEKAVGRWDAERCREELSALLAHPALCVLGETEHLSQVITSKAMIDLEADIAARAHAGVASKNHRVDAGAVDRAFGALSDEIEAKLGVKPDLGQQRAAARYVCCDSGDHAFVEGWAGAGKTTALKAIGSVYASAGFKTVGCAQSAAASQNLSRETGIRSSTIASLLLAIDSGKLPLGAKSVIILDEAGMVGSREFSLLQGRAVDAGAKLVCVCDSKQLQPIEAGGIFRSLIAKLGGAEISNIQRQRTDTAPLLRWLSGEIGRAPPTLPKGALAALKRLPEDAVAPALDELAAKDERLAYGLRRWRDRFDHLWMREAVESFAIGKADRALALMDERGRLRIEPDAAAAMSALIDAWDLDKTALRDKTIIAGRRDQVRELNERARARAIERGLVDAAASAPVEIEARDGSREERDIAPGDRLVFTQNDRELGVANGSVGTVERIEVNPANGAMLIWVELDDLAPDGRQIVSIPALFAKFDHAWCLTNHKSQGRTFDSAHVLVNAAMADREWSYVAASRSRFATTLYVDAASLSSADPESHREDDEPKERAELVETLASRMSRARVKATTLDFAALATPASPDAITPFPPAIRTNGAELTERFKALAAALRTARIRAGSRMDSQPGAARWLAPTSSGSRAQLAPQQATERSL